MLEPEQGTGGLFLSLSPPVAKVLYAVALVARLGY